MMPMCILLITNFHMYCSYLLLHNIRIKDALNMVTNRSRASDDTKSNTRCEAHNIF